MVTSTVAQPTSIHPLRRRNPNQDRYVWELRGAYAGVRVWDNDFAMSRDPWIYERMERDPLIRQCLWDRVSTVGGREWRIKPARKPNDQDKAAADIMEQCIMVLDYNGFHAARINLARFLWYGATFGALYGGRVIKKFGAEWENRDEEEELGTVQPDPRQQPQIGGAPPPGFMGAPFANFEEPDQDEPEDSDELPGTAREWWVPTRIRDLSKRRIRVWREDGKIKRTIERILNKNGEISYERDDFPEDRVIAAIYDDQEGTLGMGRGLADACYWPFKIRWKIREEGYEAANAWAQGILHGRTDATAVGSVSQGSEDVRNDFLEAIKAMKARGVIVTGTTEEITPLDGLGAGSQLLLDWDQRYADDMRCLITGAKLPTGGGGETGSLSRAGEEAKTSEGQYQTDSDLLDDVMTTGLIKPVWERNKENLEEIGLGEARMPFFVSDKERHESKEEKAATLTAAHATGMDLVADEAYDMLGLTQPSDQDRERGNVIEAASDMPPGFDPFGDVGGDDDGGDFANGQGDGAGGGSSPAAGDRCPPGHNRDRKGGVVGKCVPKKQKAAFSKEESGANAASPFARDGADYAANFAKDWKESEHPRESDGEFAPKGGGGAKRSKLTLPPSASVTQGMAKDKIRELTATLQDIDALESPQDFVRWGESNMEGMVYTPSVDGDLNLDNADGDRAILKSFKQMEAMGIELPAHLGNDCGEFRDRKGSRADTVAGFFTPRYPDAIFMNPCSSSFTKEGEAGRVAREAHFMDWWSTPHEMHAIVHENGHRLHYKQNPEMYIALRGYAMDPKYMDDLKSEVPKSEVSEYGQKNPHEFVAEFYTKAKLNPGWEPSEAAQKWYDFYEGPKL